MCLFVHFFEIKSRRNTKATNLIFHSYLTECVCSFMCLQVLEHTSTPSRLYQLCITRLVQRVPPPRYVPFSDLRMKRNFIVHSVLGSRDSQGVRHNFLHVIGIDLWIFDFLVNPQKLTELDPTYMFLDISYLFGWCVFWQITYFYMMHKLCGQQEEMDPRWD